MVNDNIWLVVDLPLWKMEWKSVGMIFHSQLNGKIKFMNQNTNQQWSQIEKQDGFPD